MTVPTPPFFSSSILENYPVLSTAGPAPGIPLVIQMNDKVIWFPYSAYGLVGDDAVWGNVAVALAQSSPFCNHLIAAAGQYSFNSISGPLGQGALELPGYNLIFEGQHYKTQFNMFVGGIAVYCHGNVSLLGPYKAQGNGTIAKNFVIDGTGVANNLISTGADFGSAPDLQVDFTVQNFTATGTSSNTGANPLGAVGFGNSNRITWTEKMRGHIVINNCANAIQYVTPTGTAGDGSTSHMYQDMTYHINLQPRQNAIVVARQGHIMNGRMRLYGNMYDDTSPNTASVIVLGVGNQQGHIIRERMEIYVEADNPSGGGSSTLPFTITFGNNSDNVIQACHGYMRFLGNSSGGFQNSNLTVTNLAPFVFFGMITGDNVLSGISNDAGIGVPANNNGSPWTGAVGFYDGAGGIYCNTGDYFKFQLSGSITINLAPNPNPGTVPGGGFGGARRMVILIQQAGGAGGNLVTWPHPGSPTLGNPIVLWSGGSAPVMTAGANKWDKYELVTTDGITYFGTATQNLS